MTLLYEHLTTAGKAGGTGYSSTNYSESSTPGFQPLSILVVPVDWRSKSLTLHYQSKPIGKFSNRYSTTKFVNKYELKSSYERKKDFPQNRVNAFPTYFYRFKTFILIYRIINIDPRLYGRMKIMKTKLISIVVCTLVIVTAVPTVSPLHLGTVSKIGLNGSQPCSRSDWIQLQKLLASDGAENDQFGYSVSVSGDTALIGSRYGNSIKGAAYVFTYSGSTWKQQAELTASDGVLGDLFGHSVCVSGDTALIGAYVHNSSKGAVYVFTRSGSSWTQQAELTTSDSGGFGYSVSLSGDSALISAPGSDSGKGAAYVFTCSGSSWIQQAELAASDGAANDSFGVSVSLSGDTALIGAYGCNVKMGAAYVFTWSGSNWSQQAKLTASDGEIDDLFGYSVSVSSDTACIGAPGWPYDNLKGAVYMFAHSGSNWSQQAKLIASDGNYGDSFGDSVSVSGDTALIGAPWCDNWIGATYVFSRSSSNWTQQAKLTASDGAAYDEFGHSVCVSGDTALIGARGYEYTKGAVYVFISEQPPTTPTISGPTTGKVSHRYDFTFNSTDPNGDNVWYYIDWGDNTSSRWHGPFSSGVAVTQSHTWTTKGPYIIKAKAKDIYGNESGWGTLSVTMPLSYEPPHFRFLNWLLERFPNAFPILRYFFNIGKIPQQI
jgi:hypothetical protein